LFIENLQRAQRRQISPKKKDTTILRSASTLRRSLSDENKDPMKKGAKKE